LWKWVKSCRYKKKLNQSYLMHDFCNANHQKSSWPNNGSQHKVWKPLF
jgi:hypothetical protein